MRNIFLEKPYIKCGGETIPRPFSKKSKLGISLDQYSKVLYSFFVVCQVEDYRNVLELSCKPLAYTSYKAFLKNKKRSGTNLPASFSAWFLEKNISLAFFRYWARFVLQLFVNQVVTSWILKLTFLTFSSLRNQAVFSTWPKKKSRQKLKYLENEKRF